MDTLIGTHHSGTSICRAWDEGLKYLDEGGFNFMLLLTDGVDNIDLKSSKAALIDKSGMPKSIVDENILNNCIEEVCKRVSKWCDFGPNKIMSYSRLTQGARVEKITEAASKCENIEFVDGLNIALLAERDITINVSDFKSSGETRRPLRLNNSLSGEAVVECDNDLFDLSLEKGGFINGNATLVIRPKVSFQDLRAGVGLSATFEACVESEDKEDLNILLNDLTLRVEGNPERVLSVSFDKSNLGLATHYRKFLWKKASVPDTLYTNFSFAFNEYAVNANSWVEFDVYAEDKDCCEFFIDGSKVDSFTVSQDSEVEIGLVFKPGALQQPTFGFQVVSADNDIDRIDNARLEEGEIWKTQMRAKYRIRTNPLKTSLIIISLLLLGLLAIWILVLRYIFFPRFKVSLVLVGKGDQALIPRKAKGFVKFVITSSPIKQSLLRDIFVGKVQYFRMDASAGITEDIIVEPFDKQSIRISKRPHDPYIVSMSRLKIKKVGEPSEISEVINRQNNKNIRIQIQ